MPIDTGDTAWMLVAGSLVLLMIPALGLFESGLLRKKNAVSVFMQIFFGLALLSVMWFVFGFSLAFGPDDTDLGLIGNMDWVFLKGVPWDEALDYAPTIPGVLFVKFQLMFAAITPLLLTGTIAERMKFSSFIHIHCFMVHTNLLSISTLGMGRWLASSYRSCRFCWWYSNPYKCRNGCTSCRNCAWTQKVLWSSN